MVAFLMSDTFPPQNWKLCQICCARSASSEPCPLTRRTLHFSKYIPVETASFCPCFCFFVFFGFYTWDLTHWVKQPCLEKWTTSESGKESPFSHHPNITSEVYKTWSGFGKCLPEGVLLRSVLPLSLFFSLAKESSFLRSDFFLFWQSAKTCATI